MKIDALLTRADAHRILESALQRPEGLRVKCPSRTVAVATRQRLNYWRARDREANRQIFAETPEHALFERSAYDVLVLRIPPAGAADQEVLYIEHRPSITIELEPAEGGTDTME